MIPVLFDPSTTSFNSNGIGPLIDTISCKVIEELNGQYELEMTYPKTGKYFSEIKYSSIILAKPFQNGEFQAFRIYKISKPMKGNVQIYARHISYQLNYIPCSAFSGQSCAEVMANIKTAVAEYCPFNFSTDITENRTKQSKNLLADLDTTGDSDAKAPDYLVNQTYAKGDYVKYSGKIYQAIVENTDEEWTKSHWQEMNVPYVGFTNAAINNVNGIIKLVEDVNALTVWIRCEKSKRYVITKMLSHLFTIGTMTQIPSAGKIVSNIVTDPTKRKLEYTTSSDAEYLLVYLFQRTADGDIMDRIVNSAAIRSLGTYTWMLYEPKTIRTFLLGEDDNSIQAIYGGEYEWDNYNVILHENRGSDKGVRIRYGKNLLDLTQEENIENTITGIYPVWKSDGTVVELPEKVVHSDNAGNFPYLRTIIQDFSGDFDNMPTEDELRDMANLYIQNEGIGVPEVSLTVNFVNLSETEEYKDVYALQSVNMGDLVTVEFPDLEVMTKQKVSKTEYDVLNERYLTVTIGNLEKKIDTTLEDQMNALSQKVSEEEAQNKIDRATGVMNAGTRGHVIIGRNDDGFANEMFFLDNPNVALAKNVLRINMNGIGFSSNGIRGPYYQAWTLDGHLSLGGIGNNHGTLEILDSDGTLIGSWDNNGINSLKGSIRSTSFHSSNDEFYVEENGDEAVEVGWSGWSVWNRIMQSNHMGWETNSDPSAEKNNPASDTSASAAINGGDLEDGDDYEVEDEDGNKQGWASSGNGYAGTAGFKALWLDRKEFYKGSSDYSYTHEGRSDFHLWDVGELILDLYREDGVIWNEIRELWDAIREDGGDENNASGSHTGSGDDPDPSGNGDVIDDLDNP